MKYFHLQNRKGQSLVEALVALSILVTALLGIETLLTRSFLLDRVTADQTKATYLASEGVEIMKSMIDHQVYDAIANPGGIPTDPDTGGWNNFCELSPGSTGYYEVDYMATSCPSPINPVNASPILFDAASGLYSYNDPAGTPSAFTRVVGVKKSLDNNEIDILSTVTWSTSGVTGQSLTVEDHFYNWNPGN